MCLKNMAVAGEETSFTTYSIEWFDKIKRGGLFPLNDETFTFLPELAPCMLTILPEPAHCMLTVAIT